MNANLLTLNQVLLRLPKIDLLERSEQAFREAFLKAAQIQHQHLEEIKSAVRVNKNFTREPFNLAILGLFSKMCSHYYSYVLIETYHNDQIGSQFLIENLCEAAITLTYFLEEVDKGLLDDYISASVAQANNLLIEVEEELQKFPNHPDLLGLKDHLKTFVTKHQNYCAKRLLNNLGTQSIQSWGMEEADDLNKRGAIVGLNFLTNPARQIALKVMPASWLELQLSYLNSFAKSSNSKAIPGINFQHLRDASHLCLHAAQTFLEEVSNYQDVTEIDIKLQQQILNGLYEWFHRANHVYELHHSAII